MAEQHARFERDGDVGLVVLDSPPLNLWTPELQADLETALDRAEADGVRALVIRAEGRAFTGGVDVHHFQGKTPDQADEIFQGIVRVAQRLEDMPLPALASVHALCLTWGLELALGCDLIFAAESAKFGLVEKVIGLTPAGGGTQRIAERAGPARARELVMSGELFDAATLERWNVVNRVFPDERLAEETAKFAAELAAGPTLAHAATKRLVRAAVDDGARAADARIRATASALFDTEDLQAAVDSFLADGPGKASFKGS
ncbi:MAG TPA: enoyl-CoA hydratase/isomerase family protein [Thermoleophilaceae bacterium]